MKSFLTVEGLNRATLEALIDETLRYRDALDERREIATVMRDLTVTNLFFEASTRTKLSFATATDRLGGHVLDYSSDTSSEVKGESLRDTVLTIGAITRGILVVRHRTEGVPDDVSSWTGLPVVNAGDGTREHPTQALLDLATMYAHFGRLEGLRVVVTGDIVRSRVAGSLVPAMSAVGCDVVLCAPSAWLPQWSAESISSGVDEAIEGADVVYALRVQRERGAEINPEYVHLFQVTSERLGSMSDNGVVMHPGPVNRGVELAADLPDDARSLILEQVANGVPARMAVLARLSKELP